MSKNIAELNEEYRKAKVKKSMLKEYAHAQANADPNQT
jgi:hypothetical protein